MTLSITIIDPWRFYIWKNFPWRGELLAVSWLQNHDVKLEATTLFFADDSLDEISSSSCRCQLTGSRLWHHKESKWRFRILQSSASITEIRSSREDLRINSELIQSGRQTKILVTLPIINFTWIHVFLQFWILLEHQRLDSCFTLELHDYIRLKSSQ